MLSLKYHEVFPKNFTHPLFQANRFFDDDYDKYEDDHIKDFNIQDLADPDDYVIDDYVIDESKHFDLLDLVGSLPNTNVTDTDIANVGLLTNQTFSFKVVLTRTQKKQCMAHKQK